MKLILRKFRNKDLNEVINLINRNIIEVNSKYYHKKTIKILIEAYSKLKTDNKDYRLIVEKNNKIIGTGLLSKNLIKDVFVLPDYHSKGIGKIIMNKLETIAKRRKIKRIILSASKNAIRFYENNGYNKINKPNKRIGTLMEKKI